MPQVSLRQFTPANGTPYFELTQVSKQFSKDEPAQSILQ